MCECVPAKNLFTRHGERDLGLAVLLLLYMDKDPTKQRVFTNVNNVNFTSSILTMTKSKRWLGVSWGREGGSWWGWWSWWG